MLSFIKPLVKPFVLAFLGTAAVMIPGVLTAPDLGTATGLAVAAIVACVVAGLHAVERVLTPTA